MVRFWLWIWQFAYVDGRKSHEVVVSHRTTWFCTYLRNCKMKWANRIQKIVEGVRNTKNWLLGRQGLAMAVIMLLLAVFMHWLGYFSH
ncbi:hypothetical protein QVD17_13197 [Tagetes erecta]|uniref:Uncharacterized protein n=1 Tax=Tagetes erecta TaxID=13708 RepID=A0AAD8P203_TARER|nr:hypothetical protein QVD17_13197 [Tagetes erecta]